MQLAVQARPTTDIPAVVARWQARLGLDAWRGGVEAVAPMQVCDDEGAPGQELVGVVIEAPRFTIVHTRDLSEHDVIHELLHVAFPDWDHNRIERWTDILHDNPIDVRTSSPAKETIDGPRHA